MVYVSLCINTFWSCVNFKWESNERRVMGGGEDNSTDKCGVCECALEAQLISVKQMQLQSINTKLDAVAHSAG